MPKKELKMRFPSIDDLFTTEAQRQEAKGESIVNLPINEIDEFPKHPFKVNIDENSEILQSIKEKGVLVPAIVRKKAEGRYELISGHRRKKASELLNLKEMPCIVRDLTDDEATIIMVDSNMQREKILPSEKAFAYKMKMEAIKHQGSRNDLTSDQVGRKSGEETASIIGKDHNDSQTQVRRYIRLTYLIPELLKFVDNDVLNLRPYIAFSPAVELSFLTKSEQECVVDCIDCYDATPSYSQAMELKRLSQSKELDVDLIHDIMSTEKANQIPKIRFNEGRIMSVLPKNVDRNQIEDYVVKSIDFYTKYLKQKELKKNNMER